MEFHYKKKGFVISFIFFLISSVFLVIDVWQLLFSPKHVSYDGLLSSTFIFGFSLLIFKFYYSNKNIKIIVDDECIRLKNGNVVTQIKWLDVTSTNVIFSDLPYFADFPFTYEARHWSGFFKIAIISSTERIEIGQGIVNIYQLISFIKSKLGDKFDTKEIPVEFKCKQR